jgi:hypothetical protein
MSLPPWQKILQISCSECLTGLMYFLWATLKDSHLKGIPVLLALLSSFLVSWRSLPRLHQRTFILFPVVCKGQLFSYEGVNGPLQKFYSYLTVFHTVKVNWKTCKLTPQFFPSMRPSR